MTCQLCQLEHKTHWYLEMPEFIVCDCSTCNLPMVVLREHTMQMSFSLLVAILAELEELFGSDYTLRCNQRIVPDHLHWHIFDGGRKMQTFKRICIKDYSVSDDAGKTASVERGKEYLTTAVNDAPAIGPESKDGHVIVFSDHWFPVPVEVFAGEEEFTDVFLTEGIK